jgi:uncharacterized protein (TIGR02594 family)
MKTALGEWGISDVAAYKKRIQAYLRSVDDPLADPVTGLTTKWCAAFVQWCLERNRIRGQRSEHARDWLKWGVPLAHPEWGCVTILWRLQRHGDEGHVAFFTGFWGDQVGVLGGNQRGGHASWPGQVCFGTWPRDHVLGYRWPWIEAEQTL